MKDDAQGMLGKLMSRASGLIKPANVHQFISCTECGEWVAKGNKTPCGAHPPIPEPKDDATYVFISLEKSALRLEEPPKVQRIRKSDSSPNDEPPIEHEPVTPRPRGKVSMEGGYKRRAETYAHDDFQRKLDAHYVPEENPERHNPFGTPDPRDEDEPHYTLEK